MPLFAPQREKIKSGRGKSRPRGTLRSGNQGEKDLPGRVQRPFGARQKGLGHGCIPDGSDNAFSHCSMESVSSGFSTA